MLKVVTHIEDGLGTVAKTIVATTEEDWRFLQQVFQRATNIWPDAPARVKEIADIVTNGKVMQDYSGQDTSSPLEKKIWKIECPACKNKAPCKDYPSCGFCGFA